MTDKTDLIREIHEYVTTHGGENTATHLLVQAASAIQTQAAELEAVSAGGVRALSAAPAEQQAMESVLVDGAAAQPPISNTLWRMLTGGYEHTYILQLPNDSRDRRELIVRACRNWRRICAEIGNSAVASAVSPQTAQAPQQAAPKAAPGDTDGCKQALGSNNCMQCCVSYMLGLPLVDVPHFADGGGWDQFASFVESKGYSAVMLPGEHEPEADYLASGRTERGTSHMVVMNDGKLVFDPHPSNAGLSSVQCVWLLAKRAAPQQEAQDATVAAFEVVRKKLCTLPRYSFVLDDDGLVRRVQDRTGNWIEFDEAHALFDPVAVDAALAAQGGKA